MTQILPRSEGEDQPIDQEVSTKEVARPKAVTFDPGGAAAASDTL
jgi:hypothetical protein